MEVGYGTRTTYVGAFLASVLLILAAYFLVVQQTLSGWQASASVGALAFLQALIQLRFFLHLGKELKPRWNLLLFLFTVMVLMILIVCSLWIMHHLDYNLMPHD